MLTNNSLFLHQITLCSGQIAVFLVADVADDSLFSVIWVAFPCFCDGESIVPITLRMKPLDDAVTRRG